MIPEPVSIRNAASTVFDHDTADGGVFGELRDTHLTNQTAVKRDVLCFEVHLPATSKTIRWGEFSWNVSIS